MSFLENRFRTLEAIVNRAPNRSSTNVNDNKQKSNHQQSRSNSFVINKTISCIICNESHYIGACPTFLDLSIDDRLKAAHQNKICVNCLVPGHSVSHCRNKMNCTKCNKRHHTLLHNNNRVSTNHSQPHQSPINAFSVQPAPVQTTNPQPSTSQSSLHLTHFATPMCNTVLLATALINVKMHKEFLSHCEHFLTLARKFHL